MHWPIFFSKNYLIQTKKLKKIARLRFFNLFDFFLLAGNIRDASKLNYFGICRYLLSPPQQNHHF